MVTTGQIPEPLLDDSVEKVISAKRKWLSTKSYENLSDEKYGENLLDEIARRSVCCLKGEKLRSKKAVVYVLDVTQSEEDIQKLRSNDVSRPFLGSLAAAGIDCEERFLPFRDAEKFLPKKKSNDSAIICLVYTSVAAWKEHTNLPRSFKAFLRQVSSLGNEKILISFGSPYVVRGFKNFDTILCAFDRLDVCQRAIADALLGRIKAEGHLPVEL
jgi:beta-N-acetylhexosaminidase